MSAMFLKGDRAQMTGALRRQLRRSRAARPIFGTVTSDQRLAEHVNVREDGRKQSGRYAARFWVRVKEPDCA
jgi:hypothetical protein